MIVTIYHNPGCGTSRNTLAMIRQSGEEPVVTVRLCRPSEAVLAILPSPHIGRFVKEDGGIIDAS